jgi:type VI secretion system protein VasG
MTAEAREGKLDRVVGRDQEIRQLTDVLMRRRQNNPILTGEAGVGKTAIVEGLAGRIVDGDVPPPLKGVRLLALDIGALSAGASMKGEFEKRLKQVIDEVQASTRPIIMFIDEAHTLIGAGGAQGTGDAANLLKPALARGELRTIAATTWSEYKKYIEKDPALTRRFQVVKVDEPDDDNAISMMRAISGMLEKHHKVRIMDEALKASVILSRRYIADRQLPDKSVSLLDTACARVTLSQSAIPARVEASQRRIKAYEREKEILLSEEAVGIMHTDRIEAIIESLKSETEILKALNLRWADEKELYETITTLESQLAGSDEAAEGEKQTDKVKGNPKTWMKALLTARDDLEKIQGEDPLILPAVDETAIAQVVADWTGVPLGRMVKNEMATILNLADTIRKRVVGQDTALHAIAKRVRTSRAGLGDPQKPVGVFMLCGPSGVGKTETALALAENLYGGEHNLITLNMSEFQEAHTVSTLKGAPPGYVGYGEGGKLTEAVRRKPYSVVLLDEIEKAHSDVHEVFFQVFDKGAMEDGEGRKIDFKNTLIILTSNVGSEELMQLADATEGIPDEDEARLILRESLLRVFPAALLGRMIITPYYPLTDEVLKTLIKMRLDKIIARAESVYGVTMTYSNKVIALILDRCQERESGGRVVDAILTNTVLPKLSEKFLSSRLDGTEIASVSLLVKNDDFVFKFK